MGRRTKRKLLKRSGVPVGLWVDLILAAAFSAFSVFLLITAVSDRSVLLILVTAGIAGVSAVILISIWRLLSRKIVFLDKYISYTGWYGRPKIYRYEDIVDLQTVVAAGEWLSRWPPWEFEDNVTIIFADGEKLRVPTSAMKPREVRRRIESKTGLKFETTIKV